MASTKAKVKIFVCFFLFSKFIFSQLWPSKYSCANMHPNVVPPGMQAADLDKLTEVNTPWVHDSASSNYHSMIAYSQKVEICD